MSGNIGMCVLQINNNKKNIAHTISQLVYEISSRIKTCAWHSK